MHDVESWKGMWQEVGDKAGTEWKCEAWVKAWEDMGWDRETTRL